MDTEGASLGDFRLKKVSTHYKLSELIMKPLSAKMMNWQLQKMNLRTDLARSAKHREV